MSLPRPAKPGVPASPVRCGTATEPRTERALPVISSLIGVLRGSDEDVSSAFRCARAGEWHG